MKVLVTAVNISIGHADFLGGRTRIDRLRTIGVCSKALGADALGAGVKETSNGKDADAYRDFVALYKNTHPNDKDGQLELSDSVAARIEAVVTRETDRMENDLKGYKNNLIKESIRVG